MEFYLSDADQDRLGRALHDLEVLCPRLDEMMVPSTPASGTNAGARVKRRGSRPPVVVGVLDVKLDVGLTLARWVTRTVVTLGRARCTPPGTNDQAVMAAWLHGHLLDIAAHDWAGECADAVLRVARRVVDLVDPPEPAHAPPPAVMAPAPCVEPPPPAGNAPPPVNTPPTSTPTATAHQRGQRDYGGGGTGGQATPVTAPATQPVSSAPTGRSHPADPLAARPMRLERGTARQVAEAARLLGEPVSHTTVRKWARMGAVRVEPQADGSQLYWLADVIGYARQWRRRLNDAAAT